MKAAACALSVSEPAVSQALGALRKYFDDPLLTRGPRGMELTAAGSRLFGVAAQMVSLGAEADAAVRSAKGRVEQLRLVADSTVVEFVSGPLAEAFTGRSGGTVEVVPGVASSAEMAVLVSQRLVDLALGPYLGADPELGLVSEPIMSGRLVVLAADGAVPRGSAAGWLWLVDPSGTDSGSDVGRLLRTLAVPQRRIRVYPNQTAAWEAAAEGVGVAPAVAHLAVHQTRRHDLRIIDTPVTPMAICWHATTLRMDRCSPATTSLRHFLSTPEAMRLLRTPAGGVAASRFRPPVYLTMRS